MAITCQYHTGLYNELSNDWMVQYPKQESFKDKVNLHTEYVHLAFVVVKYVFLERFPEKDVETLIHSIFESCKGRKSMAFGLFDLVCVYPDKVTSRKCGRLMSYIDDPRLCLDCIRCRNGRNAFDVLGELESKVKELLNRSVTRYNNPRTMVTTDLKNITEAEEYLIVSYRITKNFTLFDMHRNDRRSVDDANVDEQQDPLRNLTVDEELLLETKIDEIQRIATQDVTALVSGTENESREACGSKNSTTENDNISLESVTNTDEDITIAEGCITVPDGLKIGTEMDCDGYESEVEECETIRDGLTVCEDDYESETEQQDHNNLFADVVEERCAGNNEERSKGTLK
jgi:hypothetical protein